MFPYLLTLVGGPTRTPPLAVSVVFPRHAFHLAGVIRRCCAIRRLVIPAGRVPRVLQFRVLFGCISHLPAGI